MRGDGGCVGEPIECAEDGEVGTRSMRLGERP